MTCQRPHSSVFCTSRAAICRNPPPSRHTVQEFQVLSKHVSKPNLILDHIGDTEER